LTSDDLPTLDLPTNATSAGDSGSWSTRDADVTKLRRSGELTRPLSQIVGVAEPMRRTA
jgi:hypothetical protein